MKKLILVCGLWLALGSWARAQTYQYVSFTDATSKEWYTKCSFGVMGGIQTTTTDYLMQGDTALNGRNYKKLYVVNNYTVWTCSQCVSYAGGLLDSAGKIYYKSKNDTTLSIGSLLFDFSHNLQDSAYIAPINAKGVVVNIDTILVGGALRKRFQIAIANVYDWWVEGFGSTRYGLTTSTMCFYLGNLCVADQDGIHVLGQWQYCLPTDAEEALPYIPFSLTPNPASSYLTVSINEEHTGSTLALTDLAGRVVLQSEIENPKSEISIATLPSGIYLAVLTTPNGQRAVKKLVKE